MQYSLVEESEWTTQGKFVIWWIRQCANDVLSLVIDNNSSDSGTPTNNSLTLSGQ